MQDFIKGPVIEESCLPQFEWQLKKPSKSVQSEGDSIKSLHDSDIESYDISEESRKRRRANRRMRKNRPERHRAKGGKQKLTIDVAALS